MDFSFSNLANSILVNKKIMGGFLSSVVDSTKNDILSEEEGYKYDEEEEDEEEKEDFDFSKVVRIIFEMEK